MGLLENRQRVKGSRVRKGFLWFLLIGNMGRVYLYTDVNNSMERENLMILEIKG